MKTPHVTKARRWAREVASGKRVAGKHTKLAAQRFLDDIERKDLEYRPSEGERACRFVEKFNHVKGRWARDAERILLEDWQCFVLVAIFSFYHLDGTRRFTEAYIRVARKNGKSIIAAAIGLYMFVADGEYGAEVYSGATTEKQAWEVFRPAKMMAQRHPEFSGHYGVEINAKNMNCPEDDSRFEPVIGSPGDGSSPSCAIIDEFHEHSKWDLYQTMDTGMGSRDNPLRLIITTAGTNVASPCFEKDDDCKKILEGTVTDDSIFAVIFSADDDDDWTSVGAMKKANPNLGVSVSRRYLERQLEKAKRSSAEQAAYKTKNLNIWVSSGQALLNSLAWAKCGDSRMTLDDMDGKPCIFGIDLSARIDVTALMRLFFEVQDDGNLCYWSFPRFWLPENRLEDDKSGQYARWASSGALELHDEDEIDYARVRADIKAEAERFYPMEIAYDPWRASGMEQELTREGFTMVKIPQIVSHMTDAIAELEAAHLSGRITHNNNPMMNWMAGNLVAKEVSGGRKPIKELERNKIDGCLALLMAMSRAIANRGEPSYLSTSDLVVL